MELPGLLLKLLSDAVPPFKAGRPVRFKTSTSHRRNQIHVVVRHHFEELSLNLVSANHSDNSGKATALGDDLL